MVTVRAQNPEWLQMVGAVKILCNKFGAGGMGLGKVFQLITIYIVGGDGKVFQG